MYFLEMYLSPNCDGDLDEPDEVIFKVFKDFRIIGVIDIDAFECQVWQRKNRNLIGFPCVVADKSGRIVSVTHEAKAMGITRSMRVYQAKRIFHNLHVFEKPHRFGKPDNQETRDASWDTTTAIKEYCLKNDKDEDIIVEYQPNDQWFFDLTKYVEKMISSRSTWNIKFLPCLKYKWKNMYLESEERLRNEEIETESQNYSLHRNLLLKRDLLIIGGAIMHEITEHVLKVTRFHCSAGVAKNILQAKLGCQYNKPKAVTILTEAGLQRISPKIPVRNIPGLGSTLGDKVAEKFPKIRTMDELKTLSKEVLLSNLTKEEALKVRKLSLGKCQENVKPKLMTRYVSCGKNNLRIRHPDNLKHTLKCLSDELFVRLKEEKLRNQRIPQGDSVRVTVTYYRKDEEKNDCLTKEFSARLHFHSEDLATSCIDAIHDAFPFWCWFGHGTTITAFKISVTRFKLLKPTNCTRIYTESHRRECGDSDDEWLSVLI